MAPHAAVPTRGGHGLAISLAVLFIAAVVCLVLALAGIIPGFHRKVAAAPAASVVAAAPAASVVVVPAAVATPVDCSLGPWSDWSDCSPAGTQSRTRVATVQPANGGQRMRGSLDTQACTYVPPLDSVPFSPTVAGMVGGKQGPGVTWKQAVGGQGSSGFTASLWFSTPDVTKQQQLLNGWRTAAGQDVGPFTWQLVVRDGKVQFGGSAVNFKEAATAGTLAPNSWNHVALVFDGVNNVSLYLNGVVSATSWTNTLYNDADILLGILGGGGQAFAGQMKGFAIFAGALSAAACNSLYLHPTQLSFLTDPKKVLLRYDTVRGFAYS